MGKEHRFAKPGEMFKKYSPESKWVTDPDARRLLKAATAIGSTEKGVHQEPGAILKSRSKKLSNFPPKHPVKRGEVTSKDRRVMSPQREKMMHAEIFSNYRGEHAEFLGKRSQLVATHKSELEKTHKGAPESVINEVKKRHQGELANLEEPYFSEVRSRAGYGMQLDKRRKIIRGLAAEELKGQRHTLQGIRTHTSESLPAPLPQSMIDKIKKPRKSWTVVGQYKRKVKTGIASSHGAKAPFKLGGVEEPTLPDMIKSAQSKIEARTSVEVAKRKGTAEQIHSALYKKSVPAIDRLIPAPKQAAKDAIRHPLNMHKRRAFLEERAASAIHNAIYSPTAPTGAVKSTYAEQLGLKKSEHIDRVRARYETVRAPDSRTIHNIKSRIIKEGSIFRPPSEPEHLYPNLRKLGKGAAIGAGVLTAGYLVKKAMQKRNENRHFSQGSVPIGTVRFRVPYRTISTVKQRLKQILSSRRLALGGALTGGIAAADAVTSARYPDADKTRRESAVSGAKRGALYGSVLAATEPVFYPILKKALKYKARGRVIRFQIARSGARVLEDGIKIDVKALNRLVQDRIATRVKMKTLKPMPYTRASGFSERRVKKANIAKPILRYGREVIDGRHRITKKQRLGHTTVSAIKVTKKDLDAVKMSAINFDSASGSPQKRRPVTVAKDRYKKLIHEHERERMESNLTRSAIAGGVLAAALRKKSTLGKSLAIGAAAGAGTEAAVIASNRKHKDVFGDRSYAAKRTEKLPYQAAGLATTGILARRIYNKLHRFAAYSEDEGLFPGRKYSTTRSRRKRGEELISNVQKGRRLIHDVAGARRRGDRFVVVDARGREREPEWKRPWVKKLAGTVAIAGIIAHSRGIKSKAYENLTKNLKSHINRAVDKVPGGSQVRGFYRGVREETKDYLKHVDESLAGGPLKSVGQAETEEARKRARAAITRSVEKNTPLKFAVAVQDWDIRDARGKSARIYAPGSQKRFRRQKKWHEKKSNRDLLWTGLATALAGGGAVTTAGIYRNRAATEAAARDAAAAAGKVIKPLTFDPLHAAFKRWHPKLSSRVKLIHLNSKLDDLIQLDRKEK